MQLQGILNDITFVNATTAKTAPGSLSLRVRLARPPAGPRHAPQNSAISDNTCDENRRKVHTEYPIMCTFMLVAPAGPCADAYKGHMHASKIKEHQRTHINPVCSIHSTLQQLHDQ
jgi:hypothetical protein